MNRIIFLILLSCAYTLSVYSQNNNTDAIRKQMAKIRQTTNWNDPAAAKKANEEISKLSKQLMMGGNSQSNPNKGKQQNQDQSKDAQKDAQLNEEMIDQKMKIWNQVWESAAGGEGADILLAEPIREEIKEEYKADETPAAMSQDIMNIVPYLTIDMSMPGVQAVIDAMPAFRGIKTLIITTREKGVFVNLENILRNAKDFPLEELYILNFGPSVSALPAGIGNFPRLTSLGLFNNNIKMLPATITKLKELQFLYIDLNPVNSVISVISPLKKLNELGIAKTNIPESELMEIHQVLPNCKILQK